MLYNFVDVHFFSFFFFFFFFSHHDFVRADISGTVTRRDSKFSVLMLGPAVGLVGTIAYHPIRFDIFFFLFFFFSKILSGSYLWNRYSQRLQIECAAWFCGLVLHLLLTIQFASLTKRFVFYFFFFSCHDFFRAISLVPLLAETPN